MKFLEAIFKIKVFEVIFRSFVILNLGAFLLELAWPPYSYREGFFHYHMLQVGLGRPSLELFLKRQ